LIPVFEPVITDGDIGAVVKALRAGEISGSFGDTIPAFERQLASYCGCQHGVAVSSGTTALHLAAAAAGVGPGDEVLVSSQTNVATALAAYHNGAVPVPVDAEPETWNLDLDLIEGLITPRTRAILPVHLYGHPVDMDRLMTIARRHGLVVIEDCAESLGASCRGRMTGSFGDLACFSFYSNKVITTGEGGMVVTNSAEHAARLRLLRNLAFATPRFQHAVAGYNFRMTGFQAALGLSQLQRVDHTVAEKRRVAATYTRLLQGVPGLQLPIEQEWARNIYWMYALVVNRDFGMTRDQLAAQLSAAGIETRTFFCGMHRQPFLADQPGYRPVACPVADRLWESGLYLPSSHSLSDDTIAQVADAIRMAHERPRAGAA
jgi:perosamine synthetase